MHEKKFRMNFATNKQPHQSNFIGHTGNFFFFFGGKCLFSVKF